MKGKFIRKTLIKILVSILFAALLIPFPTISIPEWKIQVIDKNGNPLANVKVFQTWKHSPQLGESVETKSSDEHGYVIFPARRFFCPSLLRIPLRVMEFLNRIAMIPHGASMGGRSTVGSGDISGWWLYYREGGEMQNTLVDRK